MASCGRCGGRSRRSARGRRHELALVVATMQLRTMDRSQGLVLRLQLRRGHEPSVQVSSVPAVSPHAATFRQALRALDLILGWHHGAMPIDYGQRELTGRTWHRCGDPDGLVRLVEHFDCEHSDEVQLRLPEARPGAGPCGATALWAVVSGKAQCERAFRFRPLPSVVLRAGGSRRVLLWPLRRWADYFEVEDLNKRIAYRLGAKQCDGLPEALRIPAPGTCLRVGRSRPIPVVVSRLEAVAFMPEQVAGRLRKPPEVDQSKWRKAA